jgi:hypothetical protein
MKSSELTRWIESNQLRIEDLAQRPLVAQHSLSLATYDPADPAYDTARLSLEEDHLKPRIKPDGGFIEVSVMGPDSGMVLASSDDTQEGKYHSNQRFYLEGKMHNSNYSLHSRQPWL